MAKRPEFDDYDFEDYAEEYGEEELEILMELLEDFPELGEYLEDILGLDDEDFYTPKSSS